MKPRVYLTQAPRLTVDVTAAQAFGELYPLLPGGRLPTHNHGALLESLAQALSDFDPEKDYLVFMGDPAIILAVGMLLGLRGVETIQVLRWDPKHSSYTVMRMDLPG
jgi:hypothetical protein